LIEKSTSANGEATESPRTAPHPHGRGSRDTIAREIRDHLAVAQRRVDAEIRHYPTPIPRCDAQFNHLYELRARIARTLHAVDDALAPSAPAAQLASALAAWSDEPPFTDDAEEHGLRARLAALPAANR
jgi:hypothetical protein